jgi:hypothetical protein
VSGGSRVPAMLPTYSGQKFQGRAGGGRVFVVQGGGATARRAQAKHRLICMGRFRLAGCASVPVVHRSRRSAQQEAVLTTRSWPKAELHISRGCLSGLSRAAEMSELPGTRRLWIPDVTPPTRSARPTIAGLEDTYGMI